MWKTLLDGIEPQEGAHEVDSDLPELLLQGAGEVSEPHTSGHPIGVPRDGATLRPRCMMDRSQKAPC
jgi:hypothetical protein